jgi:hypothetical protein
VLTTDNRNRTSVDWLTLVTNLGVILGLILLAYEIREANKLATTQATIEMLDQMQQVSTDFSESEFMPNIYAKIGAPIWAAGNQPPSDISQLTELERARLFSWERGVMLRMSGHYYQYIQGYQDEQTAETVLSAARTKYPLWKALGIIIVDQDLRSAVEGEPED